MRRSNVNYLIKYEEKLTRREEVKALPFKWEHPWMPRDEKTRNFCGKMIKMPFMSSQMERKMRQ